MAEPPISDKSTEKEFRSAMLSERLRKGMRRIGYRSYCLAGEFVSIALTLGIAALFFLGGLVSRQSADLSPLRPNFERWFSQSFEGAKAELGDVELRWNPVDDTVTFTVDNVVVYDTTDQVIQTLKRLEATTRRTDLFARQPSLLDVDIVGGEVSWLQRQDGTIIAGLGTPDTVGGFGPIYEGQTQMSDNEPGQIGLNWLGDFRTLSLRESRAYIVRQRDQFHVILDVDRLSGQRMADQAALSIEADLSSANGEASGRIALELTASNDFDLFDLSVDATGFVPAQISPETGRFNLMKSVEAPIDIAFTGRHSRLQGLLSARTDITVGEGRVRLAGKDHALRSAAFSARLEPGDEEMLVEVFEINSDALRLVAGGLLREVGRWSDGNIGTSPTFDFDIDDMWLDLTPTFEAPITLRQAQAIGELDLDSRRLTLDRLDADFEGFAMTLNGTIATNLDGLSEVILSGETKTPMNTPQLLSVWPVKAADGARRWIDRSVLGGTLTDVRFDVNLGPDFFADPKLTRDRLQMSFNAQDAIVSYIRTMDPLIDVIGSGRIDGNRFGAVLESGRINDIEIVGGDVNIPRLTPKGGDIFISAQAKGELSSLMRLINQPPFQYMDRYGADPDGFGGQADVTLNIKRPLLEYFDQDRIEYSVDGTLTNATAPFTFGGYRPTDADVTLRGGKDGLFVDGPVNLGPWRATLSWAERYGRNGEPTRYRITGPMDRKTLDGFEIGFREYFGGEIDVDLEASGQGLNVTEGLVTVGLERAELSFGDIWSKSIGEPGEIRAEVQRGDGGVRLPRVRMMAPGIEIDGELAFRSGLALDMMRLDRLNIKGLIDGELAVSRDDLANRFVVKTSGQSLDISDFVTGFLSSRSDDPLQLPLSLEADFSQLLLGPDYSLEAAKLLYQHDGDAIERFNLTGSRPAGILAMQIGAVQSDGQLATLSVPDMSLAASSFLGLQTTTDGAFQLTAMLPPEAQEDSPILGRAYANDFTVREAPFLAQILSLASLTGIVDTLSGDGLSFDELSFDFGLQDDQLSVREAKLRGAAIGMTGEGEIDLSDRGVDFSGTLVPAYTANSMFGDLPIFGDLLVGRDGEGVFAVNYAVEGPFSGALISINPLSALTPGFIRGIFREDRDDLPDMQAEVDEAFDEAETEKDGATPEAD